MMIARLEYPPSCRTSGRRSAKYKLTKPPVPMSSKIFEWETTFVEKRGAAKQSDINVEIKTVCNRRLITKFQHPLPTASSETHPNVTATLRQYKCQQLAFKWGASSCATMITCLLPLTINPRNTKIDPWRRLTPRSIFRLILKTLKLSNAMAGTKSLPPH